MATTTSATTLSSASLSGLGLSGLSSGLDTSGIISKLMAIEAAPQTQLQSQLTTLQTHTSSLQSLNTAIAGLGSTAQAALAANALSSFTATSSSSAVTATASSTATAGTVSFTVDALASAQVSVTAAMSTWPDTSSSTPSITLQVGSGSTATTKTVTANSGSLDDVVSAINGSGTGVTAAKVPSGTDSSGNQLFRLQLTGPTGAANTFSVFEGSTTSGTQLPVTNVATAQDASVTLYGGTSVQQTVTSPTNTFSDLMPGVAIAVSATSSTAVSVNVASDPTAATTSAQALTAGLISVFSGIASATAITTSSSTSGGTSSTATSGGVLTGDPLVRTVNDALLSAATDPVNGKSPSSIGIAITKTGTITFDQAAFTTAMKTDPAGTTAMYQAIAQRVSDAASAASDPYTGTLSAQITSETGQQSSLSTQISDWSTKLATIQNQYETQFNAMEVALNNLSSQASYLTGQLGGLTTNYQMTSTGSGH